MTNKKCLVIGASGAIGSAVVEQFVQNKFQVWTSSRSISANSNQQLQLLGISDADRKSLHDAPTFDAVVWAQGANLNDNITDVEDGAFAELMQANVGFVVSTMSSLLASKKISNGARLCVISSIWQQAIRPNKLSYSITKSALSGLVQSAALDLADQNILVNAILPGVLDTPMTRSVLSSEQINSVASRTGFARLVTPQEVAVLCHFVCSEANTTLTGQSLVADLGFSNVRPV
jgi:NAD(P)-dependent dehydrogenase (short-subunit alcohol dehydrogenase family)